MLVLFSIFIMFVSIVSVLFSEFVIDVVITVLLIMLNLFVIFVAFVVFYVFDVFIKLVIFSKLWLRGIFRVFIVFVFVMLTVFHTAVLLSFTEEVETLLYKLFELAFLLIVLLLNNLIAGVNWLN